VLVWDDQFVKFIDEDIDIKIGEEIEQLKILIMVGLIPLFTVDNKATN
jgi:hypothetical protein